VHEANQGLRAERRAAATRRVAERRAEQAIRRRAKEQAALARAWTRRAAAASAHRPRRSGYAAWVDERDTHLPLLRADLRSRNDELAERAVEAGGGIEAVIEATGLRTRENALRAIDPAILVRAFDNAAASAAGLPDRARLRRLLPDPELVRRRAGNPAAARSRLRRSPHDPGPLARAAGGCQTAPSAAASPTVAPAKAPP